MKVDNLLFGAAYYAEYMPYERIDKDFQMMKDAGMNVIRIAESTWSTWEPTEGVFDFTHLYHMLDKATEYDLKVIVGTPTYAIPPWLSKKYPDILATTKDGQFLYGHRQLTDITNPDYLRHAEIIIRKLMEVVSKYDCVIGFQLDNETRSAGAASEATQSLFVNKLKKKYPNIEDFNREFGLDYWSNRVNRWEDFPDVRGTINGSLSAAYKAFLRDVITDFLSWQSNILHEYMRDDQFITHNFDFAWNGHSYGIQPEVTQIDAVKCMDVAGGDIYHLSQDQFDGNVISFGGSVIRSLKKSNYLVLETAAQGRVNWLPYPGQLSLAAYSHLANGANSVMYWNWHSIHNAIESYWMGVLGHSLEPNATYYEASKWRHEELKIEKHLINLKKNNRVAILVDNRSLTGLDEFPINPEPDISYKPETSDKNSPDKLTYNLILRWIYDELYKMNIEVDLVYKEDLKNPSALKKQYPLLIVPALYSASEDDINGLREYSSIGGKLFMTFKSCFSDEEIKIYPTVQPHNMTDKIGGHYDQFTNPSNVGLRVYDTPLRGNEEICASDSNDIKNPVYPVSHWIELLIPDENTEVWARYEHSSWGKYAAVLHKENVTYMGCYANGDAMRSILTRVLHDAGIKIPETQFPVIIRKGTNDLGETITYYLNNSAYEQFVSDIKDLNTLSDDINSEDRIPAWGVAITAEKDGVVTRIK